MENFIHIAINYFIRLLQMVEGGLIDYWRQKISQTKNVKQCNSLNRKQTNIPRSLSLNDVQSLFLIYGFGVIISFAIFFIEILASVIR
jgi:hypothetical protein